MGGPASPPPELLPLPDDPLLELEHAAAAHAAPIEVKAKRHKAKLVFFVILGRGSSSLHKACWASRLRKSRETRITQLADL
jgi:hypothetical protein